MLWEWMAWQVRGISIYRARGDHEVVTSVPHSRDFLDITILSIYFIIKSRLLHGKYLALA